jgi:hypothetical protein
LEKHYAGWLKSQLSELWGRILIIEEALKEHGVKLEEVKK